MAHRDLTAASPSRVLQRLVRDPGRAARVTHVEEVPARPGTTTDWPRWAPQVVVDRFAAAGIERPLRHQAAAAELAWRGTSVVLATGTASGKSLAYLLPVLAALVEGDATAVYLAPTKALAADQLRSVRALTLPQGRAAPRERAPQEPWRVPWPEPSRRPRSPFRGACQAGPAL